MIFENVMTQIFAPKNFSKYLENKMCRYYAKRLEKQGASVKADLLCSLFLSELRKKLKMATLTEAPFMVKSNFWNNKYFFLQIFAQ